MHFSLTTGEPLTMKPGLPATFDGAVWNGTIASHITAGFGQIVLQELSTELVSLRKIFIQWKKPEMIVCHYHYPPGVFTRVSLDNSIHEYIKGAGEIHLKKEQFSTLNGSKWTGLLLAQKAGDHHFIDVSWRSDFLLDMLSNDPSFNDGVQNTCSGLPERLTGCSRNISVSMQRILRGVQLVDFSSSAAMEVFQELMKKYFQGMAKELRNDESIRRGIKLTDWQNINKAKRLIDAHLNKHYTIPEISIMIGMNEFKLKNLFPKVTGFKIDEYRKYQLCIKTARRIIQRPDMPLKSFSQEAGYTSLNTFIRGFRKICFCTPGELRKDDWDIRGLPNHFYLEPELNF